MRERVYIVPTWQGLVYFGFAVLFFVWGALALYPLLSFLGFYLLIFFVFGALQTNDNLKNLKVDAGLQGEGWAARIENARGISGYAVRVVIRAGRKRHSHFIAHLSRPLEVALPLKGTHPDIYLTTRFPIGLFHAWKPASTVGARFNAGPSGAGSTPGEVVDLRDFRKGDSQSEVDWKRSAKRDKRLVRVRASEPATPELFRRKPFWLLCCLVGQPALLFAIWQSPLWVGQVMLLADIGALWFAISYCYFPFQGAGRWPALLASLLKVLLISVASFGLLAKFSPQFLTGLMPTSKESRVGYTRIAWMDPGQVANVRTSNELVLRARLAPPVLGPLYWRGMALARTDNGLRWFGAVERRDQTSDLAARPIHQKVLLESVDTGFIALDYPVEKQAAPTTRYYEALSDLLAVQKESAPDLGRYRQLPRSIEPEVQRLASDWRHKAPDLEGFTEQAQKYFHRFRYRFDPGVYEKDGLAEFLLNRQEGFCEHFAGAFATLLRLGGFPSRVVKGFRDGERGPDGTYRLRAGNAHAWVEAYSSRHEKWVRLDPTDWAATRIGDVDQSSMLSRKLKQLEQLWQALSDRWAFFQLSQTPLLKTLGIGLAFTLVVGFLLFLFARAVSRLHQRNKHDPAYSFYDIHCRKMASRGLPRLPHEGPLDYASRCSKKFPKLADQIHETTRRYLVLRYHA
jgi:hypothetical protein